MTINKTVFYVFALVLLGVFIAYPLFGKRFIPTHDGEYHIIRIHEFYGMLSAGSLFPRWAPGLNSGYGMPIFNFHYPLPNYIGSFFHFSGLSLVESFQFAEAVAYIFSIILCFFWLRKLFSPAAGFIGAVIYSFVPYWFVDLYIRGSVGEVMAICFVFMVLLCTEYELSFWMSVSAGLLILSHNILAMIFFPFLVIYMLVRGKLYWRELITGIALAAYFWIPALAEQKFVVGLNTVNYKDHFVYLYQLLIPSWGTGFSQEGIPGGEMSFQLGIMPVFLVILGLWLLKSEKNVLFKKSGIFFVIIFFSAVTLMLSDFRVVWEFIKPLRLLQYPWRLLSLMLPVTAYFGGYAAFRYHHSKLFLAGIVIGSFFLSHNYIRPVTYEPRQDEYYLSKKEFTDGTSSIGNTFSTVWAPWKQERPTYPARVETGTATVELARVNPIHYRGTVDSQTDSQLQLNTTYYPGWKVFVNDMPVDVWPSDGLLTFKVPRGITTLDARFGETPLRIFADGISLLGLFWLLVLAILKKYAYRNRYISSAERA